MMSLSMRGWGSTWHNWVWSKGVADRNTWFIALVARFKRLEGQRRYIFPPSRHYNDTCILLWHLDLQIWRFLWGQTNKQTDGQTDRFTPCACARGNYMILSYGTATYYRYLAQWSDSDTTLYVLQLCGYKPVEQPHALMRNHIQASGFTLVLRPG